MKHRTDARFNLRNCICGHMPQLNRAATAGEHPDAFQLKAGAICFGVVTLLLYFLGVWWALAPLGLLLAIAVVVAAVKTARGHTLACATRDGLIIGVAFFANVLEALNPANWF